MKFSLVSCFGKDGYSNHKETNIFQREKETICEKPECATPFLIDEHGVSVRECGPPHVLAADPHVVALPEKRTLFEREAGCCQARGYVFKLTMSCMHLFMPE